MALHPTADEILALADRIAVVARSEHATELRLRARWVAESGLTVVVVGEQKRGKSSLVNALIGRPELLPVDADVSTSAYLALSHGDAEQASLVLESAGESDSPREIDLGDLAEYSSVDPETGAERHPEVIGVEIRTPAEMLAGGVTVVDTPGVGGLLAGHAAITLAALDRADVLLFVLNESMELSGSELDFLRQATRRVTRVLFALTAIDRSLDWSAVLERDRDLLKRHAPELADRPWFPVSGRLKMAADRIRTADPERAAELRDRSRCDDLARAIREDEGRRVVGERLRGLLDLCLSTLAHTDRGLAEEERSLCQDTALVEELRRRRAEITDLAARSASWVDTVADRVEDCRGQTLRRIESRVIELRDRALRDAARGGREMPVTVIRDLADGMRGLRMDVEEELSTHLRTVCQELCELFERDGVDLTVGELRFADLPATLVDAAAINRALTSPVPVRPAGGGQVRGGWLYRSLGNRAGGAFGEVLGGILTAAVGPLITVAAAGAVGLGRFLFVRRSAAVRRRAEVEAHVHQVIENHREHVPPRLSEVLQRFSSALCLAASRALQERTRRLDEAIAEAERRTDTAPAILAPRIAEVERRRSQIADLDATARAFRHDLDT